MPWAGRYRGGVARILLTPKWIGLTLLAVVLIGAFSWLGNWQWGKSRAEPVVDPKNPVAEDGRLLLSLTMPGRPVPDDAVGAAVSAQGTYDAAGQLLVPGRVSGGVEGSWVLTPLVLSEGTAVPVVRGWVPGDPAATDVPVPTGRVSVSGWLEQPEPDALRPSGDLRDDQIGIVSSAELLSRWTYDLYQGYVVLDTQKPAGDLTPVLPASAQPPPAGIHWQNWGYAWQWWIFACFVVFFWVRMLREDLKDQAAEQTAAKAMEEVG